MERLKRVLLNDLDLKIRMGDLRFNILYINYEPPVPLRYFNTHCHSSYELHFIPKGNGILRVKKDTYPIGPGTFYLTGPDVYHEQIADKSEPMSEYCMNFEFSISNKSNSRAVFFSRKEINGIKEILLSTNFWYGTDHFNTWELLEKVIQELEHQLLGYYTTIQSVVSQVIINAVRNYSCERIAEYSLPEKYPLDNRRAIMDLFFRDYYKDLKLPELAKKMNVSVRQTERIIRQYYAVSFIDKLLGTRLEIAKDMLVNSGQGLEEIASKTGFSTVSYFCRMFKEKTGFTPTDYRKNIPI